ncbi:hypothetical protein ABIE65_003974 [Constrictibacter sp. MBR-5]|uniref:DUF3035 domain-containing protein n=1 Tax=Constrictibacter sp. MBR-5 TaxID=3156467 RepID=UPI003394BFB8
MSALRISVPVAIAAAVLVAGCGGNVKQQLGIAKRAPDEFSVVTRAPLSMPPDYGLRPPRPGERRPQEPTMRAQARGVLVPNAAGDDLAAAVPGGTTGMTAGDSALLARVGTEPVSEDIRRQIDSETARLDADERNLIERMMFWREQPPPGDVVDPLKETQRLQENAALGKSTTDGDTPRIERKPVVRNSIF